MSDKTRFNFSRLFDGDKVIWMVLFFFCITSILEVYSASSNMSYEKGNFWSPVLMHTLYIGIGIVVAWFMHRVPCRYFGWIVVVGPVISIIMLIAAYFSGTVNETHRFTSVLGISFQPSEIAKGSLVVVVAWLLSVLRDEKGATVAAFKWILGFTVLFCCLIVPENLSTAAILFIVILMMMFIGGIPWKMMGPLIGLLAIGGALGYATLTLTPSETLDKLNDVPGLKRIPTWAHRVRDHVEFPADPDSFDITTNPQIVQSHIAIATCNIVGRGPGNSTVRDFLPQAYSDFIYAIIVEELGLFGGVFILLLYITLLYRAARIAGRLEKNFPAFIMMGLALLIVTQALINMCVAVGIMPVTGQPLPLISRGGSSMMVNCAYIGMMLSISRSARQRNEEGSEGKELKV